MAGSAKIITGLVYPSNYLKTITFARPIMIKLEL